MYVLGTAHGRTDGQYIASSLTYLCVCVPVKANEMSLLFFICICQSATGLTKGTEYTL